LVLAALETAVIVSVPIKVYRLNGRQMILSEGSKTEEAKAPKALNVPLISLAPDIVESILQGGEYSELSLRDFRKGIPVLWEEQRRVFGPKGNSENAEVHSRDAN